MARNCFLFDALENLFHIINWIVENITKLKGFCVTCTMLHILLLIRSCMTICDKPVPRQIDRYTNVTLHRTLMLKVIARLQHASTLKQKNLVLACLTCAQEHTSLANSFVLYRAHSKQLIKGPITWRISAQAENC